MNPGAAGEGTCVLVHPRLQGSVSLWKLQPEAQAVWVRVRASDIGLDRDVFVACVYIPPAGSAQLLSHSLPERMGSLKAAVKRQIHYVHSASLAHEDGIVFMSEPSAARQ